MKAIKIILLVAMQLFLLGLSLHFLLADRIWYRVNILSQIPRPNDLALGMIWIGGALLVLFYWLACLSHLVNRRGTLEVHTGTGDIIRYRMGAIEEYVRLQVRNHPGVSKYKVNVNQGADGAISVHLAIHVRPVESVPEIYRQVQEVLRDGIINVLGIANIGAIHVEVVRVLGSGRRQTGPLAQPEPRPEPPIRGSLAPKPELDHEPRYQFDPESKPEPEPVPRDSRLDFDENGMPIQRQPEESERPLA